MRRAPLAAGLLPVLLLVACAGARTLPEAAPALVAGAPLELVPGTSAALPDDSVLRYLGIRGDSRCPEGVQCIHAGSAEVEFEHLRPGAAAARLVAGTERPTLALEGGWTVRLVALDRAPGSDATVRLDP